MPRNYQRLLYALTISCSSALLFLVQPMIAKVILPRFGGSAGVWVTCMLFFQTVLLLGYLYAYGVARYLRPAAQSVVHLAILLLSLTAMPLRPSPAWSGAHPVPEILWILIASVGAPYFVVSTTSPLLQSWYAAAHGGKAPYRLFALSNAVCLLGLLAYPFVIEPLFSLAHQLRWWSAGYLVLAALAALAAVLHRKTIAAMEPSEAAAAAPRPWLWIALTFCASTLWLAVANHLSLEVAAIPFLWVLPLSLYLLSFVLCFESSGWYRPALYRWLMPAAWLSVCWMLARPGAIGGLRWQITIFAAALFITCMFCHGELARTKPPGRRGLVHFYLMVAVGGALGAVFVGLIAPTVFSTFLELQIGITLSVLLALPLLYGYTSMKQLLRLVLVGTLAFVFATRFASLNSSVVVRIRNFYGTLMVSDSGSGETAVRTLYNGHTIHGCEFLDPRRSREATTFYGPASGVGLLLASQSAAGRRVGIIGLGTGALAVYSRTGDSFRFYEINPAVIRVAREYFRFIRDSAAQVDIMASDGRLALEHETDHSFDIIVLDAFSDDAIPVHLLTREAFAVYERHLRPGGVVALHITNRYLDLRPLVEEQAAALGKQIVVVHNQTDPSRGTLSADWAIIGDPGKLPPAFALYAAAPPMPERHVRLWTDDYSNLMQLWR
jgi:SAM-dependent methyltransferase